MERQFCDLTDTKCNSSELIGVRYPFSLPLICRLGGLVSLCTSPSAFDTPFRVRNAFVDAVPEMFPNYFPDQSHFLMAAVTLHLDTFVGHIDC